LPDTKEEYMKFTKILGLVACAALALMAFASTASATTLEEKGVAKNSAVTIKASLKSGSSALLNDTSGFFANTCTGSTVEGTTEKDSSGDFTGPTVGGAISGLTFKPCTREEVVVDTKGSLSVASISGTTNGTVRSIGAKVTVPSPFGLLTCVTASGEGTDIGTLTGVASGQATMDISAALNCGSITAKWTGTYVVTSPEGLGVVS
jgi:hypothetical protein